DVGRHRAVADVGVDLDEEIAADRHRLGFRMVDVAGDDRAAAGDLVADKLGGDVIRDGGAEALTVAGDQQLLAADVLADGDIFHLGGDDAAAGVVHLGDVGPGLRAEDALADCGERLDSARPVGAELAIVLWADLALGDFFDIAAAADPVAPKLGQTGHDVDALGGVAVRTAGVVERDRRLARAGLEIDGAHGDAHAV